MNETKGGSDLCFFNYFLIIVREGKKLRGICSRSYILGDQDILVILYCY